MILAVLVLVWLAPSGPLKSTARGEISAQQVEETLARGVAYLQRSQKPDGSWADRHSITGGVTALCTLALLNTGVEPEHDSIKRALGYLRTLQPEKTYASALIVMTFCAAKSKRDLPLIKRHVNWLESTMILDQGGVGVWGYPGNQGDSSNSQFALLALHEAEQFDVPVKQSTWIAAQRYWQQLQNADGSWGYTMRNRAGTSSMTCAGITSMVITNMRLNDGDATVEGDKILCCGQDDNDLAVQRGLQWLGQHFSVHRNVGNHGWVLYYLYGVERVGRMTAQRFIGGHDWYREGADALVRSQDKLSGFWRGVGHAENDPNIATSFSLLFLSKGRRPVLMAKLRHGPGNDWNNHRNDVANLTRYVESRWERDLTWQIFDPAAATPEDLLQSPVLFFNGHEVPEFTDEQVAALRKYVDRGGFIFAEACCDGDAFDRGFRDLIDRMFPEPEYQLRLLEKDHPVWRTEERVDPQYQRPLYGVDAGCRTSVIYCPEDLSCLWELARPGRDENLPASARLRIAAANSIGINVLAYATNRELKFKDELNPTPDLAEGDDPLDRAKLYVAELRHGGGCDQAPRALGNVMRMLRKELHMRVSTERRDLVISDDNLFDYHLAFMHGRHDFRLSEAERLQLRTFLDRGGILFADSICASEEFTRAFRREMKAVFPDQEMAPIPQKHDMLTTKFGGYDLEQVMVREPRRGNPDEGLGSDIRATSPQLEGIRIGDRYAVIFSPYDLSCALEKHESIECKGYVREDAARIAINVVLYSLH
jgi:hypothetical protein